jgi:hypothetical protein
LEVAFVVCAVVTAIPLIGLVIFHRLINWEAREEDTSMVGLSYALCGAVYAVVLAFVAVQVYEAMDKADTIAAAEANSLSGLTFESAGLPADVAGKIRIDVDDYIGIVTNKEWPRQRSFTMDDSGFAEGWAKLREINIQLADFEPANPGQSTIKAQMMHGINELFTARQTRLLAAKQHLPDIVWQMLVIGLVPVIVYLYLFGPYSFGIHLAVTGFTMLSIGLVFTLIIALDFPFRGDLSVGDDAYIGVKEVGDRAFSPAHGESSTGERSEKN